MIMITMGMITKIITLEVMNNDNYKDKSNMH